jgi:uroporphyrinogen decarboxylase
MTMTSRERVLMALNHEEPDRVPLFLGTSGVTTLLGPAYENLKAHLGLAGLPPQWLSVPLQYALLDEEVMQRLGSDGRPVMAAPPPAAVSTARPTAGPAATAAPGVATAGSDWVDAWGCRWQQRPGVAYFEVVDAPLAAASLAGLEAYPWPDLAHPTRFAGLAARCHAIQAAGYAVVCLSGLTLFEQAYLLRGLEACLTDTLADEELFTALMTRMKAIAIPAVRALLQEVGPYIDVLVTGDDLGGQESTLVSPQTYRRLIKPHQAEFLAEIRRHTGAKVFFHSDGDIYALLDDLVEIGVDIINPVQVNAGRIADTAHLKHRFGRRLTFCGAIDTNRVLPHGTVAEVQTEVRRRLADLAPGGGYIAAAVHCIQPDVPPANVVAMCEAVRQWGTYPRRG